MTKVPVRPMRRLSLYFEIRDRLETMPLTQHISRNVSFRRKGQAISVATRVVTSCSGSAGRSITPISTRRSGPGSPSGSPPSRP
jgi:hypothetical protein